MAKKSRKVPEVANLIQDAIIMIADAMEGKPINLKPNELSIYLNMLVAIDKNNRDAVAAKSKEAPALTDEELDSKIDTLIKEYESDQKEEDEP